MPAIWAARRPALQCKARQPFLWLCPSLNGDVMMPKSACNTSSPKCLQGSEGLRCPVERPEAQVEISSGDTAWVLISAALVMLMTPGLALFYGGLARSKNVLGTIMQSFFMLGL